MGHKTKIMYIEPKFDDISNLDAWIGLVVLSKTGKTLTYRGQQFQSLKGIGYKSNYYDIEDGSRYWISNCRKDGNDGLYSTTVHVDEDVRTDYWTNIRGMPERKSQASFRSRGKHRVGRNDLKNKVGNI